MGKLVGGRFRGGWGRVWRQAFQSSRTVADARAPAGTTQPHQHAPRSVERAAAKRRRMLPPNDILMRDISGEGGGRSAESSSTSWERSHSPNIWMSLATSQRKHMGHNAAEPQSNAVISTPREFRPILFRHPTSFHKDLASKRLFRLNVKCSPSSLS